MSISILNTIKDIETHINSITGWNAVKSIRVRIDMLEDTVGSYIATQLRDKLWSQARALELI